MITDTRSSRNAALLSRLWYAFPRSFAVLSIQSFRLIAEPHSFVQVAGESGLGKTTFINTLFSTTIKNYAIHKRRHQKQVDKTVEIEITKAELEEKFFKGVLQAGTVLGEGYYLISPREPSTDKSLACTVRLTVIDTPGFGDYVNNRDSWQPIIEFLDDQHESYMLQEQQPRRSDKIDLRVHTCLYFIRPTGHTLKPLDIEVMKRLCTRVNLIPVVAKADTLSSADLFKFKQRVSLKQCTENKGLTRGWTRPRVNADTLFFLWFSTDPGCYPCAGYQDLRTTN